MVDLSATVDLYRRDPQRNVYGCLPCPKCQHKGRWYTNANDPHQRCVVCEACGLVQSIRPMPEAGAS